MLKKKLKFTLIVNEQAKRLVLRGKYVKSWVVISWSIWQVNMWCSPSLIAAVKVPLSNEKYDI